MLVRSSCSDNQVIKHTDVGYIKQKYHCVPEARALKIELIEPFYK